MRHVIQGSSRLVSQVLSKSQAPFIWDKTVSVYIYRMSNGLKEGDTETKVLKVAKDECGCVLIIQLVLKHFHKIWQYDFYGLFLRYYFTSFRKWMKLHNAINPHFSRLHFLIKDFLYLALIVNYGGVEGPDEKINKS